MKLEELAKQLHAAERASGFLGDSEAVHTAVQSLRSIDLSVDVNLSLSINHALSLAFFFEQCTEYSPVLTTVRRLSYTPTKQSQPALSDFAFLYALVCFFPKQCVTLRGSYGKGKAS